MSFLKKLMSLFGGRKISTEQTPAPPKPAEPVEQSETSAPPEDEDDFMAGWEKLMHKRAKELEPEVRGLIISTLKQQETIPFTWESGSDEAFVELTDFEETEGTKQTIWTLHDYIIHSLCIPDAGEFSMTGKGTIYLKDNEVRAQYESSMTGIVDYDEELDEPIYSESEVQDSGDQLLFTI